ncbi:MAG TPA: prephenate dehydratase [Terriglobales bacterium]|nr:prephenate dehydratase [Terriglobales bacterium]
MKVAIQGELGSFSHTAARQLAPRMTVLPCAVSRDVFAALKSGGAQAAAIPIENSLAGSVAEHFDLMLAHDFWIEAELRLRIEHNLIAARGVKFTEVKRVLSHPVALDQCRKFFQENKQVRSEAFYDTAGSVKHVVENNLRDTAAIAARKAAQQYGATILRSGLEDNKQNFTRFFLIRKSRRIAPGANKTSIAFAVKNISGALFKALSVFALRDISLSKIESRPVPGRPWEYVFYADLLCGREVRAEKALNHLAEISEFVKVLGIYKAAK